ncbi:porin family protein [Sphingobacterium sp. SGG-5]|nr:porin family protein [Sphingobacterium sp. SGG-5]
MALLLFLLCEKASAQQYEFGISGVATGYMGDLNPADPLYYKNAGGGLFVKYNLNPTWGIRGSLNYLSLYANDHDFTNANQLNRGLLFNNDVKELSVTADFNFFKFIAGREINRYTPYILAGLAIAYHNPYVYHNDQKVYLNDYPLEIDASDVLVKPSRWALSIPVGAGFKYNISGPWSIGAEINYRTVFSDRIDNVSKFYRYDVNRLPEAWAYMANPTGQLARKGGTSRGDGKNRDGYMTAGITLTYTLISSKCYGWR